MNNRCNEIEFEKIRHKPMKFEDLGKYKKVSVHERFTEISLFVV